MTKEQTPSQADQTPSEQWEAMTDEERITFLAEKVMGWYKEHSHYTGGVWNWEKEGKPVCVATDNRPMMGKQVWNPLTDWNHWRELEEKIMEDDAIADIFFESVTGYSEGIKIFGHDLYWLNRYLCADLPARCKAAFLAMQ